MLWVKAFHIVFMVTWFAGLLYLPRLFVYHSQADDEVSKTRFEMMEYKLFAIMTIGAAFTTLLGLWLLVDYAWAVYTASYWLILKLVLVVGLFAYHGYCFVLMRKFKRGENRHGHTYFRWINEIPAAFLIGIVILVVIKPF